MADKKTPAPAFEAQMKDLEDVIASLERGELDLEAAIAAYERGRKLHAALLGRLSEFERRIEILTQDAAGATVRTDGAAAFDPDHPTPKGQA